MAFPPPGRHFDLVVANMLLDSVADHMGLLRTASELLKPKGRFLLSLNNPYSAVNRGKLETYFASGSVGHVFGMERVGFEAPYYHRTFEDLMTAFRTSGFLLRTLEDVGPDSRNPAPPKCLGSVPDDPRTRAVVTIAGMCICPASKRNHETKDRRRDVLGTADVSAEMRR